MPVEQRLQGLNWSGDGPIPPASAAQAQIVTTGVTQTTPFGFATAAQGDAVVAAVNEILRVMVAAGLMKGSA